MREITDGSGFATDLAGKSLDFLMRTLEEVVENAEFMHELERRGMDGVAAKIAKKVRVLFEYENVDAHAGEEKAQHHARGAASRDAAAGAERLVHAPLLCWKRVTFCVTEKKERDNAETLSAQSGAETHSYE